MLVSSMMVWKLALAATLLAAVGLSAFSRPPRARVRPADLRAMVVAALVLYSVGLAASLSGQGTLASVVYASGIGVSAFAGWLSRASDSGEPPADDPPDETPPSGGPDEPEFDWVAFERQLRAYLDQRERSLTPSR